MLSALIDRSMDTAMQERIALLAQQRVVAIALALTILLVVFELVRRRKLREEYSFLWIATALLLILLAWQQSLLDVFSDLIGAAHSTSALFFGALLFLMLVSLQFSIRLSKLTYRNRMLSQRVALLERELADLRDRADRRDRSRLAREQTAAAAEPSDTP